MYSQSFGEGRLPAVVLYATLTQIEVAGGVVYVDGGDERLHAVRADDGSVMWTADIPGGATRDLLITERRVYCPSGGTVYVLDRAGGRLVATASVRKVGDAVEAPPAFYDGHVFVSISPAAWSFDEP